MIVVRLDWITLDQCYSSFTDIGTKKQGQQGPDFERYLVTYILKHDIWWPLHKYLPLHERWELFVEFFFFCFCLVFQHPRGAFLKLRPCNFEAHLTLLPSSGQSVEGQRKRFQASSLSINKPTVQLFFLWLAEGRCLYSGGLVASLETTSHCWWPINLWKCGFLFCIDFSRLTHLNTSNALAL